MPFQRLITFRTLAMPLILCALGCIDFDRLGQPPPADTTFSSTSTNPIDYAGSSPAATPSFFPGPPLILDDPKDKENGLVGKITLSWFAGGMILLFLFSVIAYRRYRSSTHRRHGIGSAFQYSLAAGRQKFQFPADQPVTALSAGPITTSILARMKLPK